MNPFRIEGPACISFSGGRTSAYMLRRILNEGLRPHVYIVFCNTGKEEEATLRFVAECELQWHVRIRWLEYRRTYLPKYRSQDVANITAAARAASGTVAEPKPPKIRERGFAEVTFATASRKGEPYRNLVEMSGLPNPATRLCTTELKIRVIKKFMIESGYGSWSNVVGIRADEPERVAKMRIKPPERWENDVPLADAGVTREDVMAFWRAQSFDLQLQDDPKLGTYLGNCDMCMLKSTDKLVQIASEAPHKVDFWERLERDTGSVFRRDRPDYAHLRVLGAGLGDEDLGDCFCHD